MSGASAIPALGNIFVGGKWVKKGAGAASDLGKNLDNAVGQADDLGGGLNLFKFGEPQTKINGWKDGDRMLYLPDQGSSKANWKQNSGRLRSEMAQGKPIFDTHIDPLTGELLETRTGSFLDAERNLLQSRGWRYDATTGAYMPPTTLKINE